MIPEPESEETQTSTTTSSEPAEPTPTLGRDIDFAAEEQAIRDLYAVYAVAHGDQGRGYAHRSLALGREQRHFYRLDVLGWHL